LEGARPLRGTGRSDHGGKGGARRFHDTDNAWALRRNCGDGETIHQRTITLWQSTLLANFKLKGSTHLPCELAN
jgi:hypothetical protein